MEQRHYQVVLWFVLLQLYTEYASVVHGRPGRCNRSPVFFEQWWNAWLVNYNEEPCDHNSPWLAFCEDSGWGEEEATVVCREQGYLYGFSGYLPAYPGAVGYTHIECEGTENELKQCSFRNTLPCTSVGVVTQCYSKPRAYIRDNYLEVSEGNLTEVCIVLEGPLMTSVQIVVETRNNTSAVANFDYIPVSYTLTFGPSYQPEQCIEIQIINDSLAEGWERFMLQLTTDSSAIDIATPQFNIYIQPNNGSDQSGSCEDGSLTLSSGMNGSSLQLVEMCSEGVWSPVCDHNWTVADASVACKELGYQGTTVLGALESESLGAAGVPDCKGNETTLADCFQQPEDNITCYYVLVDCGAPLGDAEVPENEHPNTDSEDDHEDTDSDNEYSENRGPDDGGPNDGGPDNGGPNDGGPNDPNDRGPDDEVDSERESEDVAASRRPSAGVMAGVVVAVIVAVVVVVVVVGILVVVLVWRKRRIKKLPLTDNNENSSSQSAVDNEMQTHSDIHFDNPVYSSGVELTELSHIDPEHNLVNPLYGEAIAHSSEAGAFALTGHVYAVLEKPPSHTGGAAGGGASDCNHYENENDHSGDCQHTVHE